MPKITLTIDGLTRNETDECEFEDAYVDVAWDTYRVLVKILRALTELQEVKKKNAQMRQILKG